MADSNTVTVPVVFSTQTQYPLPTQKFMIPAGWRRYQLSQLINKALSLSTPVPFDFLIRGDLLRGSIRDWCAEHGVAEEETLNIEYIQSVLPPQKTSELPHDDWVSGISCKVPDHILTTSYDGHLRAFDYSQQQIIDYQAHQGPITSLCYLSDIPSEPGTYLAATSSHDLTGQVVKITLQGNTPSVQPLASLHLHTAPISSISASKSGSHLLTSSWDSLIGFFDTSIPEEDEVELQATEGAARKKRRKVDTGKSRGKRKAPSLVLKSHTARVSKAVFDGEDAAASCGFDSTVRTWDLEHGVCTNTITCSEKPFLDIIRPIENTAIASSTDRTISMFDLRSASASATALSLKQTSTPSCLAASPSYGGSEQQIVTGGYDGVARIWDLRSVKTPVATFTGWDGALDKKILDLDWVSGLIVLGGERGVAVWRISEEKTD